VLRGEKKGKEILYLNIIEHPLKDAKEKDLEYYEWPQPLNKQLFENTLKSAKKIKETTDYAVSPENIIKAFKTAKRQGVY